MSSLIFFRGFNTYHNDDLRFGPLNFGLAHKHLEPKFSQSGFQFFALPDIGRGEPQTQINSAHKYLSDLSLAGKLSGHLHFLGHSAGGVIARALAHKLKHSPISNLELKSVVSISSPHRGSQIADAIWQGQLNPPHLKNILKLGGYNLDDKKMHFAPWTSERVKVFNETYPDLSQVSYASIISGTTPDRLPLSLHLLHKIIHKKNSITDGIVEIESQAWGKVLGQYEMDHGAVLGVRTTPLPHRHRRNQEEFHDMLNKILQHIESLEKH